MKYLEDALDHLQGRYSRQGHRERAITLVRSAIDEVNKGIAFDRNN